LVYKITLEILRFTSARRAEPHHKSLNTGTERSATIQHGDSFSNSRTSAWQGKREALLSSPVHVVQVDIFQAIFARRLE
jgi:hypothetical protein